MKLNIKFENWTWHCGDGCCSESGVNIIADLDKKEIYNQEDYYYFDMDYIPLDIVVTLFHRVLPDIDNIETRKRIINHFCKGVDNPSDWAYWSGKNCNQQEMDRFFTGLGFDVTIENEDMEK